MMNTLFKYFAVAGLLLLSLWGEAQHTYAWVYLPQEGKYEMLKGDFLSGDYEREFTLDTSRFSMHYGSHRYWTTYRNPVTAFEFGRDSSIYFIELDGNFYVYDRSTDSMTFIMDISPYPDGSSESRWNFDWYHEVFDMRSMNDSLLYIAGRMYGYFNVNTYEFELIRELPNRSAMSKEREKELIWYSYAASAFDTFYLNVSGSLMDPDLEEPDSTFMFCNRIELTHRSQLLFYQFNCDSAGWFTFNRHPQQDTNEFRLYSLNTESCERTLIQRDSFFHTYKQAYYTHEDEVDILQLRHYNPSYIPCELFIDLDVADNTVEGIDYRGSEVCRHSSLPLSDEEIKLRNSKPFDSVVLHIPDQRPGQYISVEPGNFTIQNNHKERVVLMNSGSTELSDYRQAIKNARYIDTSAYRADTVIMEVSAWYKGMSSDTARSMYSILPGPDAGSDRELAYCSKDSLIHLRSMVSVSDTGRFYSMEGEAAAERFPIKEPGDTTFLFIMQGRYCADTAVWNITVFDEPAILEMEDQELCPGNSFRVDLSALPGNIEWDDGSRVKVRMLTEEGSYFYSHISEEGCAATDTFSILILEEAKVVKIDTVLCFGETFHYKGNSYDQPTLITDSIRHRQGCDSVIYRIGLDIQGREDIIDEDSLWFCSGSSLSIDPATSFRNLRINGNAVSRPLSIDQAGTYVLTATDKHGCLQTDSFAVGERPSPSVTTMDLMNGVWAPGFQMPVTYSGEIEYYLWRPRTNLDCAVCPYPELLEAGEGVYTIVVINSYDCRDTAVIRISLEDPAVYVPNVLVIDAEKEENEVFYVHANGDFKYDMQIYNRWGKREYAVRNATSNDMSAGWRPDHTAHRSVYVYIIRIEMPSGNIKNLKGTVTVY